MHLTSPLLCMKHVLLHLVCIRIDHEVTIFAMNRWDLVVTSCLQARDADELMRKYAAGTYTQPPTQYSRFLRATVKALLNPGALPVVRSFVRI